MGWLNLKIHHGFLNGCLVPVLKLFLPFRIMKRLLIIVEPKMRRGHFVSLVSFQFSIGVTKEDFALAFGMRIFLLGLTCFPYFFTFLGMMG
jgi:hypothetical protein